MDKIIYTWEELGYLHDGCFNRKHTVHARLTDDYSMIDIVCNNLPHGNYSLTFDDRDLACDNKANLLTSNPGEILIDIPVTEDGKSMFNIEVFTDCKFRFKVNRLDAHIMVDTLRKQAILHLRTQNKSLIQQAISTHTNLGEHHTNLGEQYNRDSFYDTIEECIADGEDLIVDETKSPRDQDVRYLQMMKVMQGLAKLDAEQKALNAKKQALRSKEKALLKF